MFKISIYRYNEPVIFSRRIITLLMDFLIIVFVTLIGFLACDTFVATNPAHPFNQNVGKAREVQEELVSMIEETKLGYKVENNICEAGEMTENYLKNMSLGEEEEILTYYYGTFKEEHAEQFLSEGGTTETYVDPQLKEEEVIALKNWLENEQETTEMNGEVYDGARVSEELAKMYQELIVQAREDFTSNYQPYVETYEQLAKYQVQMIEAKGIQLLLVYFTVMTIYYLLLPLILKNGASLSNKLFSMAACSTQGEEVPFWSVILKWIMKMIGYFNIVPVILVLLYSINSKMFMDYSILGMVKISTLYYVSMIVLLLSVICCAADKKNGRTLSDIVSGQMMKDLRS